MLFDSALVLPGFVLLVAGSEWFVTASVSLANRFRVPQ